MSELLTVLPEAYLDRDAYPTPTHEQNAHWRSIVQRGQEADQQLDMLWANASNPLGARVEARAKLERVASMGRIARNDMWQANLRLVDYFIDPHIERRAKSGMMFYRCLRLRQYVQDALVLHPTLEFEDIRQVGRIGLMAAVNRWQPAQARFPNIAYIRVKRAIQRGFMDQGNTIRIKSISASTVHPDRLSYKRMVAYTHSLEAGYSDELADFAAHPDYPQVNTVPLSEGLTVEDMRTNDALHKVEIETQAPEVRHILSTLNDRERSIIERRFGFLQGRIWTLEEVGKEYGLTRERIRQIEAKALARLRVYTLHTEVGLDS